MRQLLMMLVTGLLAMVLGAQEGVDRSFNQQVIQGGMGEGEGGEYVLVDESRWTWPLCGPTLTRRKDILYAAFPHQGAVFRREGVVTLGWQPMSLVGVTTEPLRYQVTISNNRHLKNFWVRPGRCEVGKPTCVLFRPQEPGTYFWQVWAYFPDGKSMASLGRTFQVVP